MTPNKEQVEHAIRTLEIPWYEAWRIWAYYRWARWRKPIIYGLQVLLGIIFIVSVLLWLAV